MDHGDDMMMNHGDTMTMMNGTGMEEEDQFCAGSGRVMLPGFQFSSQSFCVKYLFQDTVIDTSSKYAGAIVATFVMCVALEALRLGRARLIKAQAPFGFLQNQPLLQDVFNMFTYMSQVMIAYWIMLLVMLYEAGIFIAIVTGLGVGYFITLRFERAVQAKKAALEDENSKETGDEEEVSHTKNDPTLAAATPCCTLHA